MYVQCSANHRAHFDGQKRENSNFDALKYDDFAREGGRL